MHSDRVQQQQQHFSFPFIQRLSYTYLFVSDSFLNLAVVSISGFFLFSGFFSFSGYPFGFFRYTALKVCIFIGSILWVLNFGLTPFVIFYFILFL